MRKQDKKTEESQSDLEGFIRNLFSCFLKRNAQYVRDITSKSDFNAKYGGIVPKVERFTDKLTSRAEEIATRFDTSPEYVNEVIDDWNAMFYRGEFSDLYQN